MPQFVAEYILPNLTYTLIAASYLVRDVLKLRTLAIIASVSSVIFMFHKQLYTIVFWNLFFIVVNVIQLAVLIYERRPVVLSPEEEEVYQRAFRSVTKVDFLKLMSKCQWREADPGEVLIEEGRVLDRLMLVLSGTARVVVQGRTVAEVKEGLFVGEMSFLTEAPATAEVVVNLPLRYLSWDRDEFREYLDERPPLRFAMLGLLGLDLTKKIRRSVGLQTTAGNIAIEDVSRTG